MNTHEYTMEYVSSRVKREGWWWIDGFMVKS
jgi:hypothetical protein